MQLVGRLKRREKGKEQPEETRAQSTDEPEVTSGFAEVNKGRGSAGLIRSEDEWRRTDPTSRRGKEKGAAKGSAGKAEHHGKAGFAGKGEQQNTTMLRSEEEEEQLEENEDKKQKQLRNELEEDEDEKQQELKSEELRAQESTEKSNSSEKNSTRQGGAEKSRDEQRGTARGREQR